MWLKKGKRMFPPAPACDEHVSFKSPISNLRVKGNVHGVPLDLNLERHNQDEWVVSATEYECVYGLELMRMKEMLFERSAWVPSLPQSSLSIYTAAQQAHQRRASAHPP